MTSLGNTGRRYATTVVDAAGVTYGTNRKGVTHAIIGWNSRGSERIASWTTKGIGAALDVAHEPYGFAGNGDGTTEIVAVAQSLPSFDDDGCGDVDVATAGVCTRGEGHPGGHLSTPNGEEW